LVSQPPTLGAEPRPVMKIGCSKKVGLGNPPRTKWWVSELRPPFTHFTRFDARVLFV
jgi:hypothetical protein